MAYCSYVRSHPWTLPMFASIVYLILLKVYFRSEKQKSVVPWRRIRNTSVMVAIPNCSIEMNYFLSITYFCAVINSYKIETNSNYERTKLEPFNPISNSVLDSYLTQCYDVPRANIWNKEGKMTKPLAFEWPSNNMNWGPKNRLLILKTWGYRCLVNSSPHILSNALLVHENEIDGKKGKDAKKMKRTINSEY